MKTIVRLTRMGIVLVVVLAGAMSSPGAEKIRLLITSGSHSYETNQFLEVFKENPEVRFESVTHPNALGKLRPETARDYDVLVMYDYAQKISDEAQADLKGFLKAGKGLLILHHAIAAYPQWPEYEKILGGRYYLQKTTVDGVEKARSKAREGEHIRVHIADPKHPVTRGLADFDIDDETYYGFDVAADSHALLTTEHTNNTPTLAWCRTYEGARVVYLQLGHDHFAYENPNFRKLVAQAIRWVGKKD